MLLTRQGRRIQTNATTMAGGNAVAGLYGLGLTCRPILRETRGTWNNFCSVGDHRVSGVTNKSSTPDGYRHPGSYGLPMKTGCLSSHRENTGVGYMVGAGAMGLNSIATLTGTGSLAGVGDLIISMVAALSGSGTISSAVTEAFLNLAGTAAGAGDLTASIEALGWAVASLDGVGDADALSYALGELVAAITVSGDVLTSTNVGSAVWGAFAASNDNPGSMGEKLNDAGAASNPWTEVIEGSYTAAEVLRLLAAVAASKTYISGSTVTFRDLGDTKDRIVATMTGSERTAVTRDAT